MQVCFTMKRFSRLTIPWFFKVNDWVHFSKGFVLPYQFCPLSLKMNIKASHCSSMLMMVARECLIIIHSLFTGMSVLHKYVYFQRVCHVEWLCSVDIILLTVNVTVDPIAWHTWFSSLLYHLLALYLCQVIESLWGSVSPSMTWR